MIKAELYEKSVSVQLLVIAIIDFKRYSSTYCLMQGGCFICSDLKVEHFSTKLESQPLMINVSVYRKVWT